MVLTEEEKKERSREYKRLYYLKNKEIKREKQRRYYEKNKEKQQEYKKRYYQNNKDIHRQFEWKRNGVIHDDFNELYRYYINCDKCEICKKSLKDSYDRCLDHCHETGKFRKVLCRNCNINDRWIKKEKVIKWLEEVIIKIKNDKI